MFFGRERELARIDDAIRRARAGVGSLMLFTGEAGIGKSTVAREAAQRAAEANMRVAWGRCWEAGGAAPYWPWVQVFRALDREPFRVLPIETREHLQQRFWLFDAATQELLSSARGKPLAIILDDLHAADLASLHFLLFVTRQFSTSPIAIIGTARDPEARAVPAVSDLLVTISREGERVSLGRLSREDVARWATGIAEPSAVYAVTEGNPFFIEEVLRVGAHGPSDGITFVLDEHLRLLPEDVRALVSIACVFGRQIDAHEVAMLAEMELDTVRRHFRVACSLGVLEPLDAMRFQFSHVLLRDRLYERLPERSKLEWRVGLLLDQEGAAPALVAHHMIEGADARDVDLAGRATLRAVAAARASLAFESAASLAEHALERLRPSLPSYITCELEIALGEALMRAGSIDVGRSQCVHAAEYARTLGSKEQLARAALAYGSEMLAASVDPVMVRLLEDALAALGPEDSALGARVAARLAAALVPPSTPTEAERVRDLARAAVATARRLGDNETLLTTLLHARAATILLVHADEVFELTRELVDLARSSVQRDVFMIVAPKHATALLERGHRVEAEALITEIIEHDSALRYPLVAWRVPMLRAAFALFDGRFDEAEQLGDEAFALAQKTGTRQAEVVWAQQRIAIAIARGEPARVVPDAERLLSMFDTNPLLSPFRAWVFAASGRLERARLELESISEKHQLFGLIFAAEACSLLSDRDAAARVRPLLEERWHGLRFFFGALATGFVIGPTTRLLGDLARLCGRTDEARALYKESIALCRSVCSPPFLERSLAALAQLDGNSNARETSCSVPPPEALHVLIERKGDVWAIEGPARVRFHLKHTKGLSYLNTLLTNPGCDIHVLALIGADHRSGDGGPVIDARARAEYRARLLALDHEIAEAEAFGDSERANRGREEVEALAAQLSSAVGLFGRERRASSDVERARINVQRRIKDAVDSIARCDPALARYLRAAIVTGISCSFTPAW